MDRQCSCYSTRTRKFEIDWKAHPAAVFESDDWGACEYVIGPEDDRRRLAIMGSFFGLDHHPTLETPEFLERLFRALEGARGADGLNAVFTAFTACGNPAYDAIRANGFTRYVDIGLDQGVPAGWERGDVCGKMREGVARGVWAPEFHAGLHHTGPKPWLALLREPSEKGEIARKLFDLKSYSQDWHLPEYDGMSVREQFAWVATGIERFRRIFGFAPKAAINSDAFPETETVWALNGIETICLKVCRVEGKVTTYGEKKPWNMQHPEVPIGAYNPMNDVVYLGRNVFFDGARRESPEARQKDVVECFEKYNEPAIISMHRFSSCRSDIDDAMFGHLHAFLALLSKVDGLCFLSTREVGDLYRRGWSVRWFGRGTVLRKWAANAEPIDLKHAGDVAVLPGGEKVPTRDLSELPVGNYLVPDPRG